VDPRAFLEPNPLFAILDLAGLTGGDCVTVVPAPAIVVAVRMGSPSYDGAVKALPRLTGYREEEAGFEYLAVGREGDGCYTWHFWRAKGVPGERMAREIAEFIAGELRRNAREMARYGMCRSERECLESALSHLKTTRGCNQPQGELNHRDPHRSLDGHRGGGAPVYNGDEPEAYIGYGEGVKENTGFRAGRVEYKLLRWLAETGLRRFNLTEAARGIGEDARRVYQAIAYLIKRSIFAREARGWYRILVDPWELLQRIIVQGPNARSVKESVKENHGTRSAVRGGGCCGGVVGLFFDNVRGCTLAGGYVRGDRGGGGRGRVLGRGDLGRFARISYSEVTVATGTRLFDGLGSVTIYFGCKASGPHTICSDWVEWRPPSGFYKHHSIVEAVSLYRSRVLPYGFGLVARAGVIVKAGFERFRSSLYGLARQVYLALRPGDGGSGGSSGCRAPSVEFNGDDGSFSVCFKCPPTLYRRLINAARAARRDWNDIIVEVLSGALP